MLHIYLPKETARSGYVFESIFREGWGIDFQTTSNQEEFATFSGPKINYSYRRFDGSSLFIRAAGLLEEDGFSRNVFPVGDMEGVKVLFPNNEDDLGFDVFSSVFFMLSRYEEYLPHQKDQYGRFTAKSSLAHRNQFLHTPAVDIWVNALKKAVKERFSAIALKESSFNAIMSYDIDVAYKYKGRSLGRNAGSSMKDLIHFNIKNLKNRFRTLLGSQKDPWDVYDELRAVLSGSGLRSLFFFLLGDKSQHDRNIGWGDPATKELVDKVKAFAGIGIHPSFTTTEFPDKIHVEKERLETLSLQKINKSRQHYLRFAIPDTFNALLSVGITEDYSMCFSDEVGFRAGTCKPFYFYDLKKEQATKLKIFPVSCMDATFIYYQKKSPEKSLVQILSLLKEVKKVNGIFIPIFHNDLLGEYPSWKAVHDKTVQQTKSYMKIH